MREADLLTPIPLATARQALHERLPHLPLHEIIYLGGASYSVFRVDGEYVFRFPKHLPGAASTRYQEASAWFAAEHKLLERVRAALQPHQLPVQTHELPGPSPAFAGPVFGYRYLAAHPLDSHRARLRQNGPCQTATAALLGDFLTRLHRFDLASVRDLGWRVPTAHALAREWVEEYEGVKREIVPQLAAGESAWLHAVYEEFLAQPGDPAVALIHGDLGPENVLVDKAGCTLYVIDWEDAGVDHPAKDFCLWYGEIGPGFLDALLEHYQGADPGQIRRAVRFYYHRIPVIYLAIGRQYADPGFFAYGRALLQRHMQGAP